MFGFTQTNEYDLLDPKACTYVFISVYVCVYCIYFMYFFVSKNNSSTVFQSTY